MGLCIVTLRGWMPQESAMQIAEAALAKARELGASVETVEAVHSDQHNVVYDYQRPAPITAQAP